MGGGDVAREAWTADSEALCQLRDYVPAEAFGLGRPGITDKIAQAIRSASAKTNNGTPT